MAGATLLTGHLSISTQGNKNQQTLTQPPPPLYILKIISKQ